MRRVIAKIKQIRQYQYFELYAAVGVLILALAAYYSLFNRSFLVVVVPKPTAQVLVDGKEPDKVKIQGNRQIITLIPGIHTLRLSSPDTVDYVQTVTLWRGLRKTVNPALKIKPIARKRFSGQVEFLTPGTDPDVAYYLSDNGRTLYKFNFADNTQEPLTDRPLRNVWDINWSADFKLAFIEKSSGYYLYDFGRYNLLNQEEIFIGSKSEMSLPIWDPQDRVDNPTTKFEETNRRIAYFQTKDNLQSLVFTNQLNQNQERVAEFSNISEPKLAWSADGRWIVISHSQGLILFDVFTREQKTLISGQNPGRVKFSPNSQRLAWASDKLNIINLEGQEISSFDYKTDIHRLVWTKDSNYLTLAIKEGNTDKFYKFDIYTQARENYIYDTAETIEVDRIILNALEDTIIFQSNDQLYSLLLVTED